MNKFEAVKHSFGRALIKEGVFDRFYEVFLKSHPDIPHKFRNTDFKMQKKLLRRGVTLSIMFAEGNIVGNIGVDRIKCTHAQGNIDIAPQYYVYWKMSLLQALSEYDPKFTPELKKQWSEVLQVAIKHIVGGYLGD